jgi:hypothetical protein
MQSKLGLDSTRLSGRHSRFGVLALVLWVALCTPGCISSLAMHSDALSAATTPVVDQAAAAYRAAVALHDRQSDYEAFAKFDVTPPVYNPREVQPLLSEKDLQVRLTVLAALQCYAQSLVEITKGTGSPALDEASKSVGNDLALLGNTLAPSAESVLGIVSAAAATTLTTVTTTSGTTTTTTSSSSSTPAPPITPEIRNGIGTAVDALAKFLISREIRKELPQKIKEMDPHLQSLCELFVKEIDLLKDQEQRDYNYIIDRQTLFIRTTSTLNPEQRREEIMKLPEIVRQQRAGDEQLARLRASIAKLALTHHALAADAQGNNPQSLTSKLAELGAAGSQLGKFYSSLPAK